MCEASWPGVRELALDPSISLCGYQANFSAPKDGWVLVTHLTPSCGTTFGLKVAILATLYHGPYHTERKTGSAECESLCLDQSRIEECEAECDMAWVRRAMQYIRRHEWPEAQTPEVSE
jgi:hypothetical protein